MSAGATPDSERGLCQGSDRAEAPGFLAIEPDTEGGCVWWLDVMGPDHRPRRFHFPTQVRCAETRAVVLELLGPKWKVEPCR